MLAHGTTVIFDVQGSTGGYLPIDDTDLRTAIIGNLAAFFEVLSVAIVKGSTLANIIDFQWLHWNYSATVIVRTRIDYALVDDLRGVIATAFYDAGGAVPSVTIRTVDDAQAPAITNQGVDFGSAIDTLINATTKAAKPVTDLITHTEWLIVGGLVVIVALIVFSPAGKAAGKAGVHLA